MDYKNSAKETLEYIGGKENIVSAAHCATRLRLVIADNSKCDKTKIENVDGVKGVFEAQGQLQIIFGTGTVNKVYDEFIQLAGITGGTKEDVKQAAASKQNIFKRGIKTLGDVFVPIIPAIVASGLLMGLLEGFCNLWPQMADSSTYTIIHLFSNAAFVFLPILIAISAAKTFGGNVYLGAVIGMIMVHTSLVNAWSVASMAASDIPKASVWFGLYDIDLVGYQGHVIPVVIAVFLMSVIEKKLHKIVPEMIDLFVTPLLTVLVTGYLTLTIIGPIFSTIENWVLTGAQELIALPFGLGGALVGGLYAPTVVAGLHHMYNAIEAGMLSSSGLNTWMPVATAANVAQGAACLAVAVKSKSAKTKSVALPAALSAYLGITEPAIFGVNVRYMKPFIAGCIGGVAGGLVAGITGVGATAYGITGLFGFLITTNYAVQYALIIIVATVVGFGVSFVLFKEEPEAKAVEESPKKDAVVEEKEEASASEEEISSPVAGAVVETSGVADPTFASEMLGTTVAIEPENGTFVAPCDGEIVTMFPTGHAVAIQSPAGAEILIHIGIDTVKMEGAGFTKKVDQGAKVKKGDVLIEADLAEIKKAGYPTTTMMILTNADDFAAVEKAQPKTVSTAGKVMKIKK